MLQNYAKFIYQPHISLTFNAFLRLREKQKRLVNHETLFVVVN